MTIIQNRKAWQWLLCGVEPKWHTRMLPELRAGKRLLIVAYISSVRSLTRMIEGSTEDAAANFGIATAIPLVYLLDDYLKFIKRADLKEHGKQSALLDESAQAKPLGLELRKLSFSH